MPTQSIASRQSSLLGTNFLDLTGKSRLEYSEVSLDSLSDILAVIAIEFSERLRQKLNDSDRVASGNLSDSIMPTRVSIFGKVYQVDIKMADYYDYVNKGVKGWEDQYGGSSPYQFKNYSGRSGKKDSAMITAIKAWVLKEGLKGALPVNRHPLASRRDKMRSKLTDPTLGTAITISRSIRRKGLKPSHFLDDTISEMTPKIAENLGKALKLDIITNIIPKNGNRS